MTFPLIRFALWSILAGLPFAWYAIAGVIYPDSVADLAYLTAIAAVLIGTISKLPLRAGVDPVIFPVRAAAGCASLVTPASAVILLWAMPHLEPRTNRLILLIGGTLFLISILAFATISRVLRDTSRP